MYGVQNAAKAGARIPGIDETHARPARSNYTTANEPFSRLVPSALEILRRRRVTLKVWTLEVDCSRCAHCTGAVMSRHSLSVIVRGRDAWVKAGGRMFTVTQAKMEVAAD